MYDHRITIQSAECRRFEISKIIKRIKKKYIYIYIRYFVRFIIFEFSNL